MLWPRLVCALLGNSRFPRDTQDLGTLHSQILITTGVLSVLQTNELLGMLLSGVVLALIWHTNLSLTIFP